jgi:hypothetical protein
MLTIADQWHFDTETNPDARTRTSDIRIRIRIRLRFRILLYSPVTFKMQLKIIFLISFFAYYFLSH